MLHFSYVITLEIYMQKFCGENLNRRTVSRVGNLLINNLSS